MRARKGNRSSSFNSQNEDGATNVSEHLGSDSCGSLHSPATPSKSKLIGRNLSQTRMSVPRPHSAGPQVHGNVWTSSLSTVSSVAPMSGRSKARTGNSTPDTMAEVEKCARRTFQGGPISEERFREMQAESYRLKRELAEKADQNKALVARLNRAEDAVKRKLRLSVEKVSLLPKEKLSALTVLTQNYNTEKRVEELEERLRGCLRDNRKYLQHANRCKAETEWFKRRLDATTRASRRAGSCNCQSSLKRYEKMAKDLRKKISSLQKKKDSISCCATNQSAVVLDVSKLSTEDQNCPTEFPCTRQCSGSHFSASAPDPVDKRDHLEETERDGNYIQRPSDPMYAVSPTTTESLLKEAPVLVCDASSTFDETAPWERLKILSVQYNIAIEDLRILKVNHDSCIQKLQETHRKLNQERANCLKLEAAEKRLSSELMAAKHLEPLLKQVRQQNVQLEIENAELVASALNVPRTNFSELKSLRQQLVDELKQRKTAEAKALSFSTQLEECKQDLARLAVVEANWEFLKSELAAAKAAASKAGKKVKELQDSNKRFHKQINLKGSSFLRTDSYSSVSIQHGASCEEEEVKRVDEGRTKDPDFEPEYERAVEDKMPMQDKKIGLQALRHRKTDDVNNFSDKNSHNIAVKLCSSVPWPYPNHIIMTILRLELNASADLSSFNRIRVCFQFLADYCEPDDQRTPLVSNDQAVLHFSYSRAFCVDEMLHRDACESLKNMLELEMTASVQFQVLGEDVGGRPEILLGSCQVDLWAEMYEHNRTDLLEAKLEVSSESSKTICIGYLHIMIDGLNLLRDIHGHALSSSPVTPHRT